VKLKEAKLLLLSQYLDEIHCQVYSEELYDNYLKRIITTIMFEKTFSIKRQLYEFVR